MHELILGGARSGKSRSAERLALESGQPVTYIATCQPRDAEMAERVARHRARRPENWELVEEPMALAQVLQQHASPHRCLLVDCLTLWLSNLLLEPDTTRWAHERQELFKCLPQLPGRLIMVSNETGLGVVPMGELSRRFVDEAGWLHQELAAHCDRVVVCIAGLPQTLKGDSV